MLTQTETEKVSKDFTSGILNSLVEKRLISPNEKEIIESKIDKPENI